MEPLDMYQHEMGEREQLELSASQQLDVMGMQPHSREHLEHEMNCGRSERKYAMIEGYLMDYVDGLHFSGSP